VQIINKNSKDDLLDEMDQIGNNYSKQIIKSVVKTKEAIAEEEEDWILSHP
jgi:hypothetical protein